MGFLGFQVMARISVQRNPEEKQWRETKSHKFRETETYVSTYSYIYIYMTI
jgi:hypothetical protein